MPTLRKLAEAARKAARPWNHTILVYGPPKTGKTRLVGTAAQVKEIRRIYWFDLENGSETLLNMGLTDEELDKITLFKVTDTRSEPTAIETILRAFSSTSDRPAKICVNHGRVDCPKCTEFDTFSLTKCTSSDLIVIDSLSQLGESAINAACLGKPITFKPGFDEWGIARKYLVDILAHIQSAHHTNYAAITHELLAEDNEGKERIFPLCGTKPVSAHVAKYFATVIYQTTKLKQFIAHSTAAHAPKRIQGSRINIEMEKQKEPSLGAIFEKVGLVPTITGNTKDK